MKRKNIMKAILTTCFIVSIAMATACGAESKDTAKPEKTEKDVQKTAEATIEPEETVEPMKVKKNTLLYSWKTGKKNTPGYEDKDEKIQPDCFYLSGERVFLDDTVNQRILIYKNGKYEKSISLEWNYDVKRMYYSATDHILKTVYEDLSYSEGPVYGTADYNVDDGTIVSEKQISDAKNILEDFYFRKNGELDTFYLNGEEDKVDMRNYGELKKLFSKDDFYESFSYDKEADKMDILCSKFHSKNNQMIEEEWITRIEKGKATTYAVPAPHKNALEVGALARINENLYQLAVEKDKVSIYVLQEKKLNGNKVEMYTRYVN
jgi:hypothetical protein